tara:strand:+ start:385 stop:618 length:234 start_codon:yes stop_codon:yes gene_type:complete
MLRTYIVTVDIKESHTYEVKASSKSEAYEKIAWAELYEPSEPVSSDTGEPLPGVEYGDCEVYEKSVSDYIQEVEAGE